MSIHRVGCFHEEIEAVSSSFEGSVGVVRLYFYTK